MRKLRQNERNVYKLKCVFLNELSIKFVPKKTHDPRCGLNIKEAMAIRFGSLVGCTMAAPHSPLQDYLYWNRNIRGTWRRLVNQFNGTRPVAIRRSGDAFGTPEWRNAEALPSLKPAPLFRQNKNRKLRPKSIINSPLVYISQFSSILWAAKWPETG